MRRKDNEKKRKENENEKPPHCDDPDLTTVPCGITFLSVNTITAVSDFKEHKAVQCTAQHQQRCVCIYNSHSAITAVTVQLQQSSHIHSKFTTAIADLQQSQSIHSSHSAVQSNGGATWIRVLRRVSVTTPSDSTSNSC